MNILKNQPKPILYSTMKSYKLSTWMSQDLLLKQIQKLVPQYLQKEFLRGCHLNLQQALCPFVKWARAGALSFSNLLHISSWNSFSASEVDIESTDLCSWRNLFCFSSDFTNIFPAAPGRLARALHQHDTWKTKLKDAECKLFNAYTLEEDEAVFLALEFKRHSHIYLVTWLHL